MEWFREKVKALDVGVRPPEPLLKGRDLLDLGMAPGPRMGQVLQAVYELQLDGAVQSLDDAREQARRILAAGE
jgi:tRNA nucleotidyltransferase (CCA-adding enzyme)